jgi:hypothetical protein
VADAGTGAVRPWTPKEVTAMSWVIVVILAVLALLILAGPPLENLIDRLWPPEKHRTGTAAPARRGHR